MAHFFVDLRYRLVGGVKLIEKLKFTRDAGFQCFPPEHQPICLHPPTFNRVTLFKHFRSAKLRISCEEFFEFYELLPSESPLFSQTIKFKNFVLIDEAAYRQTSHHPVYQHHSDCAQCTAFHTPKAIRKQHKMTDNEQKRLAKDIGLGHTIRQLVQNHPFARSSIMEFKRKLLANFDLDRKKRVRRFTSLTPFQQKEILHFVRLNPFTNLNKIRTVLKLNVSPLTIRKFLKLHKFGCFSAAEQLLISPTNERLRRQFCSIMSNLDDSTIQTFVFCDEKTLQNHHNGPVRVYRQRGRPNGRQFIFRRHSQCSLKVNLFGFITSSGIGDLFVFDNKTRAEHFVNYLEVILPAIARRYGSREFVLILDNATIHNANITFEYLHRAGVKLLIWPPQSPDFNVIKNVWSCFQRRFNHLVFDEGAPVRLDTLIVTAFRAWYSIEERIIKRLYRSFLRRVRAFAAANPI